MDKKERKNMQKLREFKGLLKKGRISTAIFFGEDKNINYFTEFDGFACLIIPVKKMPILIVPELEYTRAMCTSKIKPIKWEKDVYDYIKKVTKGSSIGIDKEKISYNQYKRIKNKLGKNKIKDISNIISKIRQTKTEKEIIYLKIACEKTDKIVQTAIEHIKKKKLKTETDVASFLVSETIKKELEIAFNPIVASGKNSRHPHHKPQNIKLKQGFCVIDYGVKYKNYCADMTRTIFIGTPSKNEIKEYNQVLNTQKKVINGIKNNKLCSSLHKLSEKLLKQKMIHALGHGIGIDVHESPAINSKSKDKIKNGMVIAIEPGIYQKGGIRIEDTLLIRDNAITLTKTPKTLISIKKP